VNWRTSSNCPLFHCAGINDAADVSFAAPDAVSVSPIESFEGVSLDFPSAELDLIPDFNFSSEESLRVPNFRTFMFFDMIVTLGVVPRTYREDFSTERLGSSVDDKISGILHVERRQDDRIA
jgi:hypothetical protein